MTEKNNMNVKELKSEDLAAVNCGGHTEEWAELKDWAIRHNPEWIRENPDKFPDGPVVKWLFLNIPEYDGCTYKDDGPTAYFVKGQDKPTMNHKELMVLLISKYGE